jgi:hypothetical protein
MRLLAIVPIGGAGSKVGHFTGLPPALTDGKDTRQQMGGARFAVIEDTAEGVFLYRYGSGGEFVGDTWHQSIDDAKHQAVFEYGDSISTWSEIPPAVQDVVEFGINQLGQAG